MKDGAILVLHQGFVVACIIPRPSLPPRTGVCSTLHGLGLPPPLTESAQPPAWAWRLVYFEKMFFLKVLFLSYMNELSLLLRITNFFPNGFNSAWNRTSRYVLKLNLIDNVAFFGTFSAGFNVRIAIPPAPTSVSALQTLTICEYHRKRSSNSYPDVPDEFAQDWLLSEFPHE